MARGYVYEIVSNEDEVLSMSECDLYDYTSHEFDYVEDLDNEKGIFLAEELLSIFSNVEKCTRAGGDYFKFTVTKEDKIRFFEKRFAKLKRAAEQLTLEQFAAGSCYEIQSAIEDRYGDAVYCDSYFGTFDNFVREAVEGKTYFLGNVCLMH